VRPSAVGRMNANPAAPSVHCRLGSGNPPEARPGSCVRKRWIDNRGMSRSRYANLVWASAGLMLLGACASPGPSAATYATRQIRGSEWDAVFDAGEAALTEAGYRIERRDKAAGVITTQPITGLEEDRVVPRRAHLSSTSDTRRVAEVHVEQTADTVSVYCRVMIQEQTTQAHRLFELDHRGYDTPTDTPIEREAATTVQQNTVWRTIRRDNHAERVILAAITARTGECVPADVE